MDTSVAVWNKNAFLLKKLREDSDNKYTTKEDVTSVKDDITKKQQDAEKSIQQKQEAAEEVIGRKKEDVESAIETQKKAAENTITDKQKVAVTAVQQKQEAVEEVIDRKKEDVESAIETQKKAAENTITDKQKVAVTAIQEKKDEATQELEALEKKKMQISEEQAQKLKEEQEELKERIAELEQQLSQVSDHERELSKQEAQELKNKCDELKQELKSLQEKINEAKQEVKEISEAEVNLLKEGQAKLANELQTVKNERTVEAQKSKEAQRANEQKMTEEKIAQEVKQKEELEHANNKVARSQDVTSNAATSIKSMEMLSHAVNLAISQLVRDRISNITQINRGAGKNLIAQVNRRKMVASGSQLAYINRVRVTSLRPKSWHIWGSTYIGKISQGAINNYGATLKTGLHGFVLGIDKIFGYNILGFAISYGRSRTRYTVPQLTASSFTKSYNPAHHVNAERQNSYYQASMYVRYSPNDRFFVQLLGGLGTYAQDAKISNLFSNSNATSGYSVNATIGYHYYSSEKLVLTPTLGILHNYLNIPGQSNTNITSISHRHAIINKIDVMIGLNVKFMSTGNVMGNNVQIIPEVTAAIKFRIHENNEEKAQVPVALMPSSDDLLSNITAAPRQSMQVGAKLTIGNDTVLFGIYGYADVAVKYHALTCGINVKLYL